MKVLVRRLCPKCSTQHIIDSPNEIEKEESKPYVLYKIKCMVCGEKIIIAKV